MLCLFLICNTCQQTKFPERLPSYAISTYWYARKHADKHDKKSFNCLDTYIDTLGQSLVLAFDTIHSNLSVIAFNYRTGNNSERRVVQMSRLNLHTIGKTLRTGKERKKGDISG